MLQFVGPCHHHYYADLYRQLMWLERVSTSQNLAGKLDLAFRSIATRFPPRREFGIRRPLPLEQHLDDTPIESFLRNLSDQIDALEKNLLLFMDPLISAQSETTLCETAGLWGRNLGQEVILSERHPKPHTGSLQGLRDSLVSILAGGEWPARRYLFRRQTMNELSYELLSCPHRRQLSVSSRVQDYFCRVESAMYAGFLEALVPEASYKRTTHTDYCVDFIRFYAPANGISSER